MAVVLQRMAVCQQVPGSHDVQDSEAVEIARLAGIMSADETQLLYSICIHGRGELGLAPDEYTGLTMSLLRLLAFKPKGFKPAGLAVAPSTEVEKKSLKPEPPAVIAAPAAPSQPPAPAAPPFLEQNQPPPGIESAQDAINSVANAQSAPEPIQTVPTRMMAVPLREQGAGSARTEGRIAPVEPDAHHEAWVQLVQQLLDQQSVQGMVQQLAVQSQCVEKGASHLTLRIGQPSLKSDGIRDELQNALQALGRSEALVIEVGPVQDSWAKRNNAKLEARQKAAEALIQNDPQVQELIAQFIYRSDIYSKEKPCSTKDNSPVS
jgi:DNA polymerase III subunit gamma/tau